MSASPAAGLLARQLKQMQTDKDIPGISCGLNDSNIFEWQVMLMINDECKFYGGMNAMHGFSKTQSLTSSRRWLLPSTINFSFRISTSPSENEIRDPYISPKQYVL
jgi:hypothetical protein